MKIPFDIDIVMDRIREEDQRFPKAELFDLFDQGYRTAFEQVVACILSIRTLDEVSGPLARRFFAVARTPAEVSRLTVEEIDRLIHATAFHLAKANQIHEIARRAVEDFGGEVPCDEKVIRSLPGVGPKCANLVLGIACGVPRVGVDTHVHRITNRWGYVQTKTPEQTMAALEEKLPVRYWVEINALLVPFGKNVCVPNRPFCSVCPVLDMCQQRDVTAHR